LYLAVLSPTADAQRRVLSDEEMDEVTAGGISTELIGKVLRFEFRSPAGGSLEVAGSGTVEVLEGDSALPVQAGTLVLRDSAQSGLSSLININAVNSEIQVLVNLNINIDSIVENLEQVNLSGLGSR
jgi:hypothetical protein